MDAHDEQGTCTFMRAFDRLDYVAFEQEVTTVSRNSAAGKH